MNAVRQVFWEAFWTLILTTALVCSVCVSYMAYRSFLMLSVVGIAVGIQLGTLSTFLSARKAYLQVLRWPPEDQKKLDEMLSGRRYGKGCDDCEQDD